MRLLILMALAVLALVTEAGAQVPGPSRALAWWLRLDMGLTGGPFDTLDDCERAKQSVTDSAARRGEEPPTMRCVQAIGPKRPTLTSR